MPLQCRYNKFLLAGTQVGPPSSLAAAPKLLAAQSDTATDTFAQAAAAKMGVARFFAAGGDFQGLQLQTSPGVFTLRHTTAIAARTVIIVWQIYHAG
jgi:hypothetical protein